MSDHPCDNCGKPATARLFCFVDLMSHEPDAQGVMRQARVLTRRHWVFCSPECRETWWQTETDEDFLEHDAGGAIAAAASLERRDAEAELARKPDDPGALARHETAMAAARDASRYLQSSDRNLRVARWDFSPRDETELAADLVHDDHADLNAWWKEPGP